MDVENTAFLKFVEVAEKHQVNYILIGGLALLLNGVVRFTRDVDVWLEPTNENRDRLMNVLLEIGYTEAEIQDIRQANFAEPQMIRIDTGPMDLMTQIHKNLNYDECRSRARLHTTLWNNKTYFLHINREAKILSRRPKDISDILQIDELLEEQKKIDTYQSDES